MSLPMLADIYFGYDDWRIFFACMIITAFFGGALIVSNSGTKINLSPKDGFLILNTCWLIVIIFSALPFRLSSLEMSTTDAFFESMSGLTTTGATVINNLNYAPAGILLWRSILQWLGGIGIIITATSILPFLRIGGMQLFKQAPIEFNSDSQKSLSLIKSIILLYTIITLSCAGAYMLSGLEVFDAIAHAMSTVSTGGFSTYDESFFHFKDAQVEIVAMIFMLISGLPFLLCLKAFNGNLRPLAIDKQVHWYLGIISLSILIALAIETFEYNVPFGRALRQGAFNVISVITGTGFQAGDPIIFSKLHQSIFFFLIMIGGCAGSTTAGIKIFRLQILYSIISVQIKRILYPSGVFIPYYNGKPIPRYVPTSVMSFLFVYAATFALITIALGFIGLDFMASISSAAGAIANVSISDVSGIGHTCKGLPDSAKWILCAGMFLGRIELFSFLVLLSPHFWKK